MARTNAYPLSDEYKASTNAFRNKRVFKSLPVERHLQRTDNDLLTWFTLREFHAIALLGEDSGKTQGYAPRGLSDDPARREMANSGLVLAPTNSPHYCVKL